MDICGEARAPTRKHLLQLKKTTDIEERPAAQTIERIADLAKRFSDFIGDLPIRTETLKSIENAAKANRARLI
jgi:hypothetical protein